jgi:hypothetical protein
MPLSRSRLSGLLLIVALLVLLFAACGGDDAGPTPSPTRSPRPTPTAAPTPVPTPPPSAYRLVYREAGALEDIIWRINPSDPAQREELVRLPHRDGFPVLAGLSPDGRMLAFVAMTETARSPESSEADLFVHDLARKETTKVGTGMDYQFRPVWSPDGLVLYMRRYAGAEILSSDVSLLYTRIARLPRPEDPTPRPTPRPTPSPAPTPVPPDALPTPLPTPKPTPEDPIKTMFKARYSQTMTWTPLGFDDDGKSMYFVQINGGLRGTTLVGMVTPATAAAMDEARGQYEATVRDFMQLFPTPPPEATPTPPDAPPTPTVPPSPTPAAKLVVELTDQTVEDFSLSPDKRKVSFRIGVIEGGELVTRTYVADLQEGTVQPLPLNGLPSGDHASVVWHPDGRRLAVGLSRYPAHTGSAMLVPLDGSGLELLPTPKTGFDAPRSYSPDAVWLAVTHFSGESFINPGEPSLELVSQDGHRISLATGPWYADDDSLIAWQPAA